MKKGCRLSSSLFIIALDPFLRAMSSHLSGKSLVRAFADDIAIVLTHLFVEGPVVNWLFHKFTSISNLRSKAQKCIIIPLWSISLHRFAQLIQEKIPGWSQFEKALSGK